MNKRLVIAEKPSVGMSLASVLGAGSRKDGYVEGDEYIVSWCFGHLAELCHADSYDEKFAKWRREDLPIVPSTWKYEIPEDKRGQFEILKKLMHSEDVSEVVNACDAGREGELIFRNVYELAGCDKPIKRLWISSMEDSAIREGFRNLKSGEEYENLYAAAKCREKADWIVGINATRLFSTMYHRTLNVGRVVSPTLSLIVQRDAEIAAFKPAPFYTVQIEEDGMTAETKRFEVKDQAESAAGKCRNTQAVVKASECREKSEKAPALYDLTSLQRDANKMLGYTAQQTLDYVQALYEKKLCTYPRTDSRFLTDDMEASVENLITISAKLCGVKAPADFNSDQVCDSKKVSDHHAIVPTMAAGKTDISTLPAAEREVLKLIAKRVLCAVCVPFRYAETVVTLECGGETFTAKGKEVLDAGWKAFSGEDMKESTVPAVSEGEKIPVDKATVKEGKTTPPKSYTEATLLSAMETAGAKDMPDDAERKGLGTPATRAGIIEKLISTGFVERKKAKKTASLTATQTGVSLITVLPEELQSPLLTAEWESRLMEVQRGELDGESFLSAISLMVNGLVKNCRPVPGAETLFPSGRPVVGKCPRCGCDVTESKKGFFCEGSTCRFGLWRDNKYLTNKKITLTNKMVTALLKDGAVPVKNIFSERTGKSYDAILTISDDGKRTSYAMDFD